MVESGIIDFVSFKKGIGENGDRAGILSEKTYLRRKGACSQIDTDDNMSDFQRTRGVISDYNPRNSSSLACIP